MEAKCTFNTHTGQQPCKRLWALIEHCQRMHARKYARSPCSFKMLSMSLIFHVEIIPTLFVVLLQFILAFKILGNFSHWNVFDSVMEHFRISLYEWWNIFDRKKWCRKSSVENFGVENFPSLTVEHFPLLMNPFVENFLSKVVCFPKNLYVKYNLCKIKQIQ